MMLVVWIVLVLVMGLVPRLVVQWFVEVYSLVLGVQQVVLQAACFALLVVLEVILGSLWLVCLRQV